MSNPGSETSQAPAAPDFNSQPTAVDTSFLAKKLLIILGKGGVGRSTLSLALGKLAAAEGRRTLVCLSNSPARYAGLLGGKAVDERITPIFPNLDVVNLDPIACQEEYGMHVLRSRLLHGLIFSNRVVRSFLDAVPGLAEWAMLGKATYHVLERDPNHGTYDLVIFDAPSTGHSLDLLALPRAILAAVPTGRMREEAAKRVALMEDDTQCEVVPVTLLEEIPLQETREAVAGITRLHLPIKRIAVNKVLAGTLSTELEQAILELNNHAPPSWLLPAAAEFSRLQTQSSCLDQMKQSLRLPLICFPALPADHPRDRFLADLAPLESI